MNIYQSDDLGVNKYIIGEIIWAKIKGFPWWPGIVIYINSDILYDW